MNYRGYMKAGIRAQLEERDRYESATGWLRHCEQRYADAMESRSKHRKRFETEQLALARQAVEQG